MSTAALSDQSRPPAEPAALGGLAAQTAERRAKRDALQALGINPYPTRFQRSATLAELRGPSHRPGAALAAPRPPGHARRAARPAGAPIHAG